MIRRVLVLCMVCACTQPESRARPQGVATTSVEARASAPDSVDPTVGVEVSCEFVKDSAHLDGNVLIQDFLARDAAGQFLQSDKWFDGATDCPGHEPGPDSYTLIEAYTPSIAPVNDTLIRAVVSSRRIGYAGSEGVGQPTLRIDPGPMVDTVWTRRTRYGWRIVSPALRQHVLLSAPASQAELAPFKDSLARLGFH